MTNLKVSVFCGESIFLKRLRHRLLTVVSLKKDKNEKEPERIAKIRGHTTKIILK